MPLGPMTNRLKPWFADARPELDGVERALLTDKAVRGLDVGRRLERKRRQIGGAIKPLGSERPH